MQPDDLKEYRATKLWPYHISAGCVVYRLKDGRVEVLLLSRDQASDPQSAGGLPTSYHLPKGTVNVNETLAEAAARETNEEAGVEVEIGAYIGSSLNNFNSPVSEMKIEKTTLYFAAQWQKDVDQMDSEHDGRVWTSIDKAEELLGQPNPKGEDEVIRCFKKYLELTR